MNYTKCYEIYSENAAFKIEKRSFLFPTIDSKRPFLQLNYQILSNNNIHY